MFSPFSTSRVQSRRCLVSPQPQLPLKWSSATESAELLKRSKGPTVWKLYKTTEVRWLATESGVSWKILITPPLVEERKQLESQCRHHVLLQDSKCEQNLSSQYFVLVILYFSFGFCVTSDRNELCFLWLKEQCGACLSFTACELLPLALLLVSIFKAVDLCDHKSENAASRASCQTWLIKICLKNTAALMRLCNTHLLLFCQHTLYPGVLVRKCFTMFKHLNDT